MSRDPLEDQEYDFYNAPDEQQSRPGEPATRETWNEFATRTRQQMINLRLHNIEPGKILYVPAMPSPELVSKPRMSMHKRISLLKSALRIGGTLLGCWVFRHSAPSVVVFLLFGLAEVLGVVEENYEIT